MLRELTNEDLAGVSATIDRAGNMARRMLELLAQPWIEQAKTALRKKMKPSGETMEQARTAQQMLTAYARETPFVFRGTEHDLSVFWARRELPLSSVETLDAPLREAVRQNIAQWQQQGLAQLQPGGQSIALTEAGRRHIHDVGFIQEVMRSDIALNQQLQQTVQREMAGRFVPGASTGAATQASAQAATQAASQAAAATQAAAQAGTQAAVQTAGAAAAPATAGVSVAVTTAAQIGQALIGGAVKQDAPVR